MARLVIVAGPALFPTLPILFHPIFIPRLTTNTPNPLPSPLYTRPQSPPLLRPGLSLWQVPPCNQHPHSTSIPSSSPPQSSPLLRPGLSLWQVPPHQYPPTPFSPLLPSSLTCFSPQPPSSYPSFGPACHCGRSRLVPLLTLLAPLPFWIPHSILCHSFGPACHCGRPRLLHSHCLPLQFLLSLSSFTPSKSPACHCGRSRLIFLFYPSHHSVSHSSLSLSLFSCRPARAGRHGRSKVILLTLFQIRSTSDLTGFLHFEKYLLLRIVWLCLTFRYHATMMDYVAWLCLASTSLMVVMGRYYVLAECF